jgi:hypothetical protein
MRNEPESKLLRRKEESLVRRDVLVHEPEYSKPSAKPWERA